MLRGWKSETHHNFISNHYVTVKPMRQVCGEKPDTCRTGLIFFCKKRGTDDGKVCENTGAVPEYFLHIAEIVALRMNFRNGSMEPSEEPGIKALNEEAQNDNHVMMIIFRIQI